MAAQKNILVLGTRRLAEELADLIEDVEGLRVAGFVENTDRQRCGTRL